MLEVASGEISNLSRGRVPRVARVLWSPRDERILLYTQGSTGTSVASGAPADSADSPRYYLLDAASGALAEATDDGVDLSPGWSPVWSPDGTRFAFVDGQSTVVVQGIGGEPVRYEVETPLSGAVAWSPDGLALLALGLDPTTPAAIVPLDGESPTTVLLDYDGDTPAWSPVNPVDLPTAPTVDGTTRDPGVEVGAG
jgi:Tol biopolymer transport system component